MNAIAEPAEGSPDTFADVLERLGGISPGRVVARPYPAAEDDLLAYHARTDRGCELIDGYLVEKSMGSSESNLGGWLINLVTNHVSRDRIGLILGAGGMVRLLPDQIRMPDVCFVPWDRCPGRRRPTGNVWQIAPTLAAEVLSQSNTTGEMLRKRRDYFAAGVLLVWEIDPETRAVEVFTTPETPDARLTIADTLDGGAALPGFVLPLAELFGELDRHG